VPVVIAVPLRIRADPRRGRAHSSLVAGIGRRAHLRGVHAACGRVAAIRRAQVAVVAADDRSRTRAHPRRGITDAGLVAGIGSRAHTRGVDTARRGVAAIRRAQVAVDTVEDRSHARSGLARLGADARAAVAARRSLRDHARRSRLGELTPSDGDGHGVGARRGRGRVRDHRILLAGLESTGPGPGVRGTRDRGHGQMQTPPGANRTVV